MPELAVLQRLFDELPIGVILLDATGHVVHLNKAEERLAQRRLEDVVGRLFFQDVAPCLNIRELGGRFREEIGRDKMQLELEISFPFPFLQQPRDVRVRLSSFEQEGSHYGCLFVEDITTQRAVDRMKELLGQLVVHDLKNPLSAILANLDFLTDDSRKPNPIMISEALADSQKAGARLQRMLLNLLDVSRLETGEFPLHRARTDLAALLRDSASSAFASARGNGIELATKGLEEEAWIALDKDVIVRALDNLIENAIRYTRSGGQVGIELSREARALVVHVTDQGPGIPEALRDTIFQPYVSLVQREPRSQNRGLGLTFVQMAARAHGAAVSVQSSSTAGSVFEMRFPLA